VDEIAAYDIVISTYDTVRADWVAGQKAASNLLFSVSWKRIILDEAHVIRNIKSQVSQAICALEATARWAVTGTPIQNRIGDLAALLKFIRAYPYHDVKRFDSDISQLWKTRNIEEAVNRLRKLSGGLILRRPKTAIKLPPRIDLKFPIKFRTTERELYDKVKHQTMAQIEEAFQDGDRGSTGSSSYIAVMQRINALRMICDLGLNYDSRHRLTAAEDAQDSHLQDWHTIAQETFNLHHEISSVVCSGCASACDTTAFSHDAAEHSPPAYYARCLTYMCSDCAQPSLLRNEPIMCGHMPNHRFAPISLSWTAIEERESPTQHSQLQLSSKVVALVSQLKALPVDTKRSAYYLCLTPRLEGSH